MFRGWVWLLSEFVIAEEKANHETHETHEQDEKKIEQQDKPEESAPRHREQRVIDIQRSEDADTGAFDIERAVGIKEPLARLAGDDRAESEIAVLFGLCRSDRLQILVQSFFCHDMRNYMQALR